MGAITSLNECSNLIQWLKSTCSFLCSKWRIGEEQKVRDEVLCLESSLQCMREILPGMYDLIDRAEWRSHMSNVAELLPALKDAVYDVEDLLDEFKWYDLKMKVEKNMTQPPPVEFFNNVVQGSFNRADDIQKRLDNLCSELEKMGLRTVPQRFDESIRPKTSSFPIEKKIFGRAQELKDVISLLGVPMNGSKVCPKRRRMGNSTFSVLPIIGIGDEFDVNRLTKDAIQSVSGKQATTDDLDSLQQALVRQLNKKRFLIILDDMWDDALKENGQCWKRFCAPLTNVVQGSMLLVTTRSPKIADRVGTIEPFPLGSLNDEDFWDFFKQCAFGSDASRIDPKLEKIGRSILPKLKGSPLAAKTLGRLLGMNLDTTHWNNILESNIPLQDIGSRYFDDLVNRAFFQIIDSKYMIHDLMHDMVQFVSKDDCFIISNTSDIQKVPQNVRHLSILTNSGLDSNHLMGLSIHKKLRTLLCNRSLSIIFRGKTLTIDNDGASVLEHWCTEFRRLRVIIFTSIRELPENISNLKHLRYLEISKNCMSKSLPSDFCCLYNLQILYARKSKFYNLPGGSSKLINLQRFESVTYQFHQEHALPIHASATAEEGNQLRLCDYPGESLPNSVHPENFPNITFLSIHNCNGLKNISVSRNSQQTNVNAIQAMVLFTNNVVGDNIDRNTFSSLVDVTIEKCQNLASLEQFLQPALIPNIKKVVIADCQNLESAPTKGFRYLLFLEELKLCNCPKIKSQRLFSPSLKVLQLKNSGNLGGYIHCEFLTILHLSQCHLASIEVQNWDLPLLLQLEINDCPSLRTLENLTSIKSSVILPFFQSIVSTPAHLWSNNLASLQELRIEHCKNLENIGGLEAIANINKVYINFCPKLLEVEQPLIRVGGTNVTFLVHVY
ncbi:unnamed protein product [Urochloa decumbens]|uniref:NB-ARC domain-containing protein n=1 Tax=Urochloa decumbens TaxID=240449 RepID=A0ABC8WUP5_9POAL